MGKLMKAAKGMTRTAGTGQMHRPEGAGNFDNMDDYNIVNSIDCNEGTIQNTPTANKHIVNKEYVDNNKYTNAEAVAAVEAAGYFKDQTDVDHNSITNTHNLTTDIDHDQLTNFVANEHIDWTSTSANLSTSGTAATSSLSAGTSTTFMQIGDVTMSDGKGYTMTRAGSIVGLSCNMDVTAAVTAPVLTIDIKKNGTSVFNINTNSLGTADNQEFYSTQARGTDTFAAGDTLSVEINFVAGDATTFDNVVGTIEFYYDT